MKHYKVIVNGTAYEIALETVDAKDIKATPVAPTAPVASAPAAAPVGGSAVNSPMPGTILDIRVANGVAVKKGDILMILEAMKMENEILAPCDGVVTISVAKGASVGSGDLLCTIA